MRFLFFQHGLEEKDENAIELKNRESQQFFQCEICEHFFQSESILEKHIIGHQVERVARYKVWPLVGSSPSKRKRKHSKKHKKKNEKREKKNTEAIIPNENLNDDNNAKRRKTIDLEISESMETKDDSRISSIQISSSQNNIQTESECQILELTNGSLNGQPKLPSSNFSIDDVSISTSPCETNLREDSAALVSPEIEQAVASISGPIINNQHSPKNVCEDHVNDNSILPLTSGTLEIENAVNSILGETNDLDQIVSQENDNLFEIKQNSETLPQNFILREDKLNSANEELLENNTNVNVSIENATRFCQLLMT